MSNRKSPGIGEALIQCAIVKYLQSESIYFFAIVNEAHGRSKVSQMQLVSQGLRSGVSDMLLFLPMPKSPDKIIFVEVKNPEKWKQSDNQKKFEKRVTDSGYEYHLVFSVPDVEKIVEDHKRKYWS